MITHLADWGAFRSHIETETPGIIGFDLRGTVVQPPRYEHLTRCAKSLRPHENWPQEVNSEVPKAVLKKYGKNSEIFDWTLLTALEWVDYGISRGFHLTHGDVARAYQFLRGEYLTKSTALVPDDTLQAFILFCKRNGIKPVVCSDGFADIEAVVFQRLFPKSSALVEKIFASDTADSNKLSPKYFSTVAEQLGVRAADILMVGDRADKDIKSALEAGCKTLQITSSEPVSGELWTQSFVQILPSSVAQIG